MKFKVKVGDLAGQISQAAITIDPKSLDQPNSKVFIRASKRGDASVLYFYSTNQQQSTFLKTDCEVIEPGETLVEPAKLLGGLVGRDPEAEATFEIKEAKEKLVRISIGRNYFNLKLWPDVERMSKEVDALPFKAKTMAKIGGGLLSEFIRRSLFCIPTSSNGQTQQTLDVLHLKTDDGAYYGEATDGFIVSVNYGPKAEGENVPNIPSLLIPQEALTPLQKLLAGNRSAEIDLINASANESGPVTKMFVRTPTALFGTSMRSGRFPKLALLLDQNKPQFAASIDREELKGSLTRAGNFVSDKSRVAVIGFTSGTALTVSAANDLSDLKDEVEFELLSGTQETMRTAVALDLIAGAVGTLRGPKVIMGANSQKQKALLIKGEEHTVDEVPEEADEQEADGSAEDTPEKEPRTIQKLVIGSIYAISPTALK